MHVCTGTECETRFSRVQRVRTTRETASGYPQPFDVRDTTRTSPPQSQTGLNTDPLPGRSAASFALVLPQRLDKGRTKKWFPSRLDPKLVLVGLDIAMGTYLETLTGIPLALSVIQYPGLGALGFIVKDRSRLVWIAVAYVVISAVCVTILFLCPSSQFG